MQRNLIPVACVIPPAMDEPYYVAFRSGGQDIGLNPNGHREGMSGPVNYWHVDDIEKALKTLRAEGAVDQQVVTNVGGGKLVASVKDADGNVVGLMQVPQAA